MMITLQSIQTSFIPTKNAAIHHLLYARRFSSKKNSLTCFCKSNNGGSEDSSEPEGDTRQQELLAKIMMLQTQKVRLTDYLDEKSDYLTKFAEEAGAEMDQIGEDVRKGLDEAGERIMGNLEKQMQAFEEAAELEREEIERSEKQIAEFEDQIEEERNEGLFFKSLGSKKGPVDKVAAMETTKKINETAKAYAGSKTRKNIYLGLTGLLVIGIADALISPSSDWRKIAVIGLILLALLSQFIYEQKFSSDAERTEKESTEKEKE